MLDKKLRRRVERAFYEYAINKEQGAEAIVELAERGLTAKYGLIGGGGGAGNPTEDKAIKATEGSDAILWCRVVEKTLEHFRDTGKDTLIRLKYFERLRHWKCCEKLYISESSLKLWINDILDYAFAISTYFHLIKLEDF